MITLIATAHKENGLCKPIELYNIIEQIKPDVIFEEHSPRGFDAIYKNGLPSDSPETNAILLYLKKYPIEHFPVDVDEDLLVDINGNKLVDNQFMIKVNSMFERFKQNIEYNELSIRLYYSTNKRGFQFLNSNQCTELLRDKNLLEERLLKEINDEKLTQTFRRWMYIIDLREKEMLKNIYSYCNQKKYENALFLVGAEHRWPLIEKISRIEKENELILNWNLNYFRF